MERQIAQFAVQNDKNGITTTIGKSFITQPKTHFAGGSLKWFDDSRLVRGGGGK